MMAHRSDSIDDRGDETIAGQIKLATHQLRRAGIDGPELDARLLMQAVSGKSHGEIIAYGERLLEQKLSDQYWPMIARRIKHEPVFRIIGQKEFRGLQLDIPSPVLEPRADTECLVEAVLDWVDIHQHRQAGLRIADIGTGSGAIIIALLSEMKNSTGIATDLSADALKVAQINAEKNKTSGRISFLSGSYCEPLSGQFDIIVSNPPYIATSTIGGLSTEVKKFDPITALDGGADGLDAYRELLGRSARFLSPKGCVFFEIGHDQAASVRQIAEVHSWVNINILRDLNGNSRVFCAAP